MFYADETNNIADAKYTSADVDYGYGKVLLSDPDLVSVDRIRLVTSPGFPMWDVSYVWGTLKNGKHVRVEFVDGTWQFPKRKGISLKGLMIAEAKKAGRFAKGLGMLDDDVISALW